MGTSLLNLGVRALSANEAALRTIGQNISNASTPGYSRQQVEFATAGGQFTGAGFFGRGVQVTTVTRSQDAFLTREALGTRSVAASDEARQQQLDMLEDVFPTGERGIGYAAGQLLNAFVDVGTNPADLSARQVALARVDELASRFRSANEQLTSLQAGVAQDLGNAVTTVNGLAKQVAAVNDQIAKAKGTGHEPNDLLDQRDALVRQIADLVSVTTVAADDGSMNVFTAGGQRLVLGTQVSTLVTVPDQYDPSQVHIGVIEGSSTRVLTDGSFTGGSIAGLLKFQGDDLVDARNLLGQMATAVASRVNEQQSLGLDLRQPAGSGAPLFSYAAPQALASSANARDASGNFVAAVPTLSVDDASLLQASDYELVADPAGTPGSYQLTRLSDGMVTTITSGDVVDGLRIDIGTPAPGAGDRFLLRPVAAALGTIASALSDPRGIAAASPVTATLGAANAGTASVASLAVTDASHDNSLRAELSFTSGTGAYDWTLRDASNAVVGTGSGTWTAGQPISLNGFELSLAGVPSAGDTIGIERTAYPAANNGNALAMVALRDEALVGRRVLAGGSVLGGETITNAYASAIADIGVRVQSTTAAAGISRSVANATETSRADATGVNLDEEAARLIQYQQAYSAAARVLQVAQAIFDTMLQATGR